MPLRYHSLKVTYRKYRLPVNASLKVPFHIKSFPVLIRARPIDGISVSKDHIPSNDRRLCWVLLLLVVSVRCKDTVEVLSSCSPPALSLSSLNCMEGEVSYHSLLFLQEAISSLRMDVSLLLLVPSRSEAS